MLAEALAEFKKQNKIHDVKSCIVGEWINTLSEQDKEEASKLLFDDPISNHKLHIFLETINVDISAESLRKHRMKGCACIWTN